MQTGARGVLAQPLGCCPYQTLGIWPGHDRGDGVRHSGPCIPPGSVAEMIDQGVTGAVVDTVDEAMRMLPRVLALDRHAVRRRFEQRFSSARMATYYAALYRSLLKRPSISERETTLPLSRPIWERKLNGHGLVGDRDQGLRSRVDCYKRDRRISSARHRDYTVSRGCVQ
jgi:hypothetical protein